MTTQRNNSSVTRSAVRSVGHKTLLKQEQKLAHRVRTARPRNRQIRRSAYLFSFAARYKAALKLSETLSRQQARALAEKSDLRKKRSQTVTIKAAQKRGTLSEYRILLSFKLQDKLRQQVIKNLLKLGTDLLPEQTLLTGGRNHAARQIKRNFREGYVWIAKLDVSSCFNRFVDTRYISNELEIPEQVVRRHMSGVSLERNLLRVHRDTARDILGLELPYDWPISCRIQADRLQEDQSPSPLDSFESVFEDDWRIAQQGMMQGAKCSGHAVEVLLRPVCRACLQSGHGRLVNYADDFLLMARSYRALMRLKRILVSACRRHPAGILRVTQTVFDQKESFEFLGYKFTPGRRGTLQARWADHHECKAAEIRKKTYAVLYSSADEHTKTKVLAKCIKFHRNTVESFPAWLGRNHYIESKLARLRRYSD